MYFIVPLFLVMFYMSLTIAIEVGVAYLMGYRTKNFLLIVGLASVITNPVLNMIIALNAMFWIFRDDTILIIILELIVVAVEFYILCYVFDRKYTRIKLFKVAVVINAASYSLGYFIQEYLFPLIF
ncbi:MAG: hypothetical protein KQ78_00685 [Candidatus Izimaplasma bacterium HR2]|nr:MAG: hypothetical protein KQ78_00685 [Candidatus Izimaplasma bacterium HR2]